MSLRRGGRVAEDARLESGYTERYRGFESLPHRHTKTAPSGRFFYGAEVRVRSLVGFDRSSGTIGTAAGAPQGQGTWMCPGISLPHRHTKTAPSGRFFYGAEVRVRSLVGFDRSSGTIGTAAGAPQGQGTWMCPGISLPHRHTKTAPSGRFFYGAEVRVRSLVGFDRSSGTIGTAAGAPQGLGTWMCTGISLPHRHTKTAPSGRFFDGAEVRVRSLVGFGRSSGAIGSAAGAPQGQGTWMCPGISLPHRHTKTAPSGRFFLWRRG